MRKVAIFCGGPSSEYEVSLHSASTIYKFIDKKKYEIYFFYISKDKKCKLLIAEDIINLNEINANLGLLKGLQELKLKKIFALLAGVHGEFGEDGELQSLLEYFHIPYSGSGPSASALAMDKYETSLVAREIKDLKIPKTFLVSTEIPKKVHLKFPIIIRPNELGSSVGLYSVNSSNEFQQSLKKLKNNLKLKKALLQEQIVGGIELSCGCLQKKNGDFIELPPIEIYPKKAELFDYNSKYEVGGSDEITPPVTISKHISEKISNATIQLHKYLNLKTYSRSDFIVKGDDIYFLETNTLPGMTATSLLPQEAQAAGMSYSQLLDFIIENS